MMCLGKASSSEKFSFTSEEEQKRCEDSISEFFRHGFGGHSGNFQPIIISAIETLKLGR